MSDETKTAIAAAIKLLTTSLQQGLDVAKVQLPIILQQKLRYDFWESVVWIIVVGIAFTSCLLILRHGFKLNAPANRYTYDADPWLALGTALSIITGTCFVAAFLVGISTILKITLAPNLYLLEWLKGLL